MFCVTVVRISDPFSHYQAPGGAPDRWGLADSDLAACLIQERLHVLEWYVIHI
jgi:hypothetical protein